MAAAAALPPGGSQTRKFLGCLLFIEGCEGGTSGDERLERQRGGHSGEGQGSSKQQHTATNRKPHMYRLLETHKVICQADLTYYYSLSLNISRCGKLMSRVKTQLMSLCVVTEWPRVPTVPMLGPSLRRGRVVPLSLTTILTYLLYLHIFRVCLQISR